MSSVTEHYEKLLAKHYTWMYGESFDAKVAEQKLLLAQALESLRNRPQKPLAVDLGSGPGFQTIALTQLDFSPVIAIDTSTELLNELRSRASGLPVQIENADLLSLPSIVPAGKATAIVCMGDTLTHLPSKSSVGELIREVFQALHSSGVFVVTYRDLTAELEGIDRFIPVRGDEDTIMTCFLEYENADTVVVHDLVHTRCPSGWFLNKSSYRKLRLGVDWLRQELTTAGFVEILNGTAGRLVQVTAAKP